MDIAASSVSQRVELIEKLHASTENNSRQIEQLLVSIEGNRTTTSDRQHRRNFSNESIAPFFWLHVPKTGSSFATTLAHYAAPTLPPNVTVQEPGDPTFREDYGHLLKSNKRIGRFDSNHVPLTSANALRFSGKVVVILRQPFDRALSGFYHNKHSCGLWKTGSLPRGIRATFSRYAKCVRGCTAKMLTGSWCGDESPTWWQPPGEPFAQDAVLRRTVSAAPLEAAGWLASEAIKVLRTQVGFIGLQEHWAATVCLWHARFGGECWPSEMINTRPGASKSTRARAGTRSWEAAARVWPGDTADEKVYDTGYKLFWEQVEARELDATTCMRLCPRVDRAHFDKETFTLTSALLSVRSTHVRFARARRLRARRRAAAGPRERRTEGAAQGQAGARTANLPSQHRPEAPELRWPSIAP